MEKGRVSIKPRPRSYTKHMLGLHKGVWKGVKTEEYVDRQRERSVGEEEPPQAGVAGSVRLHKPENNSRFQTLG